MDDTFIFCNLEDKWGYYSLDTDKIVVDPTLKEGITDIERAVLLQNALSLATNINGNLFKIAALNQQITQSDSLDLKSQRDQLVAIIGNTLSVRDIEVNGIFSLFGLNTTLVCNNIASTLSVYVDGNGSILVQVQ